MFPLTLNLGRCIPNERGVLGNVGKGTEIWRMSLLFCAVLGLSERRSIIEQILRYYSGLDVFVPT